MSRLVRWMAAASLSLGLLSSSTIAADPPAAAAPKDDNPMSKLPKVVAMVGGLTITREQLGHECVKRHGAMVLDNFLNKHLILQACRAKGINITTEQVNAEISRMAGNYGLTTAQFLKTLEENRDYPPERYASEIVWPVLALKALAADKIQISRDDVQKVFANAYGPKVQVRMIAVRDRKTADEIHQQVTAAPDTFKRLAKEKSIDAASASVEGLLPPVSQYSGDDALEKIAFQLQPNQVSPVFQAADLWLILQCVRHMPASTPDAKHIPMIEQRIADQLQQDRLIKASDELFKELQKGSQIVQVVGKPELEQQYPNVAGVINGQPVALDQLAAECITRHGKQVLKGEINRIIISSAVHAKQIVITKEDIDAEIARAADALGYVKKDGTPDVDAWIQSVLKEEEGASYELYVSDAVWPSVALKKLVADKVVVTEEDLQKGFESNFGPRAEVLAIVLSNQRIAEQVWSEARQNLTEANFGDLAAKYSVEPVSRSNFGKVPPIRHHSGQPTLEKAAFSIQAGELSSVIAVGEQFVIMYKQGLTEPIAPALDAAIRAELAREITEKKLRIEMQNELDRLLKSTKITNLLEEKIAAAQPPVQAASANIQVPVKR